MYMECVNSKGAPLDRCVGFIDYTKIRIERPGVINANQRSCYSGHKIISFLRYQTGSTSDKLLFSLYSSEVRRRYDPTLLRECELGEALQDGLIIELEHNYVVGDYAYVLRLWFQVYFSSFTITAEYLIFSTNMSSMREAVEWNYKDLKY